MNFILDNWFEVFLIVVAYPAYRGITVAIEKGISEIPNRFHEKNMEEIRHNYSLTLQNKEQTSVRELQIDNYYRSISGVKLEKLFSEWTNMISAPDKVSKLKQEQMSAMVKDLMMYGSRESVKLGSLFMQYMYRDKIKEDKDNPFKILYLGAKLIASMKKDFTGHEVEPEDLLSLKIKDITSKEELLIEAKQYVDKICKDGLD